VRPAAKFARLQRVRVPDDGCGPLVGKVAEVRWARDHGFWEYRVRLGAELLWYEESELQAEL